MAELTDNINNYLPECAGDSTILDYLLAYAVHTEQPLSERDKQVEIARWERLDASQLTDLLLSTYFLQRLQQTSIQYRKLPIHQ